MTIVRLRRPATTVFAILLSAGLAGGLSACGGSGTSNDTGSNQTQTSPTGAAPGVAAPSAEDQALIDSVTVAGPSGALPNVTFVMPFGVSAPTTRLVSDGAGAPIEDGQRVSMHLAAWRGDNGEEIFNTWSDDSTENFIMGGAQFGVLSDALRGAHVGARLLLANPSTAPDGSGTPVTLLTIFEVTDAENVPTRAEGETVEPAAGLPVVTLADNGAPSISIPADYKAPDQLVVQTLIKGNGPEVLPGANVTVHYTGWLLDGTVFDSSWERNEPASFGLNQVIPGWTQGLAGQTVGSQVLLVIPPALAYGDVDRGTIPANSTLVFVVDILAVNQ